MKALTTERLVLRPYRESDWEAVHEFGADPEVSRYMAWGPNTEEQTRDFIRRCIDQTNDPGRDLYAFAIALRETGAVVGGCNLSWTNREYRTMMIGYTVARPYWNRGYTTEAARELLRLGFEEMGLHRVVSWCEPENVGSWRVMEKIGMRREGHEREVEFWKSRWHDWLRYAILAHEWRAQP